MDIPGLTSVVIDFDAVLCPNGARTLTPGAADALRALDGDLYLSVYLVTTSLPDGNCWAALHAAGVSDLIQGVLDARPLHRQRTGPFWNLVLARTGTAADQVMFVGGDHATVTAARTAGLRAALVSPTSGPPGEPPLQGALVIQHIGDLPTIIGTGEHTPPETHRVPAGVARSTW